METHDVVPAAISEDVQTRLNTLNQASSLVNELEIQLDKCRRSYQIILTDATKTLSTSYKKCKSSIEKARPFFNLQTKRQNLITEIQTNAEFFNEFQTEYESAKSTLAMYDVESSKFDESDESELNKVNIAIEKVNSTKLKLHNLQSHHQFLLSQCPAIDEEIRRAKSRLSSSIKKAQAYFDLQAEYNRQMEEAKQRVDKVTKQIKSNKMLYSSTMRSLEAISNSIHNSRLHYLTKGRRSQGVGADSDICCPVGELDSSSAPNSFNVHLMQMKPHRLSSDLSEPLCSPRQTPPGQDDTDDETEDFSLQPGSVLEQPIVQGLMGALSLCSNDDQFVNDQTSGYASLFAVPVDAYASFDRYSALGSIPPIPKEAANLSRCHSF